MEVDNLEIFSLPSGLRCVARSFDGPSYCQLSIDAGSRDDFDLHPGIAHFVEHTVFRGTGKRSGYQINARAEDVGGSINAYTTREMTVYYTITPSGQLARGLELLSDVVGNPSFPKVELEREKTIINEEIKSDIDSPEEAIFDAMAERIFHGSQLAHNILGNEESVARMTSADALRFTNNLYTASNMVLSCVADMPASKIKRLIERHMQVIPANRAVKQRVQSPQVNIFDDCVHRNLNQCHCILASRTFDCFDPRRHAINLLRYYLGSGMNSLLFRELREKHGYVYTVEASSNLYTDAGCFYIYFGSAKENEARCRKLINRLLSDMASSPMKPNRFSRLKRNYAGRMEIMNSSINRRANLAGRELLRHGRITSKAEQMEIMESITAEQMRECAELILKPGLSCLTFK